MLDRSDKKYHSYMITQRFVFAVDRIVGNRSVGKTTYKEVCERLGMSSSNLSRLRETTGENAVTAEAIGRLCEHYKISALWLISETGNIYADSDLITAYDTLEKRVSRVEQQITTLTKNLTAKKKQA